VASRALLLAKIAKRADWSMPVAIVMPQVMASRIERADGFGEIWADGHRREKFTPSRPSQPTDAKDLP
jgi:hypothetical protein